VTPSDGYTEADLHAGFELPAMEREVGFANWNRYAAVNDEFVPIHMDDGAGIEAGYPTAFGMGNLHVAFINCLLRDWIGERGRIASVEVQFRQPSLRNTVNRVRGVVTTVETSGAEQIVDLDVWVESGAGVKLTPGSARVILD
jgi:hypothetical protein